MKIFMLNNPHATEDMCHKNNRKNGNSTFISSKSEEFEQNNHPSICNTITLPLSDERCSTKPPQSLLQTNNS